jgi:hypothetical protein
MPFHHKFTLVAVLALFLGGCSCSCSDNQAAQQNGGSTESAGLTDAEILACKHPLAPAWKLARDVEAHIVKDVHDYTAVLSSKERFPEKDEPYVTRKTLIKIRHQPFSAFFRVLEPASGKGDEAIYVEGKNNNEAVAHTTGVTGWLVGNLNLDPKGGRLMKDQHYPMTDVGILNLCRRLKDQAAKEMRYGDCEVTISEDAKIDGRPCKCVTVVHPRRRKEFIFHKAKIYIDKQWNVPVCIEAYDWPDAPGGETPLIERYEYDDLKINPGLTDLDFDVKNPEYGFKK